ncbi:TolC family protein [Mesobacterium pallidum]|uniref:TolC family protein n=1 Tax=Mesobacterium pallidum TaxID=2872037 RepID=UPI001EE19115|nr:TolC family protein [Mesobacterium pallidum]
MMRAAGLIFGVMVTTALSGCMGSDDGGVVSMFRPAEDSTRVGPFGARERQGEEGSTLILDLQARRSVLPEGGSYDRVAAAVLATNARAAEAELRSARLRAEAADKNWLPSIGPNISLTSLGDFVAQLLIEQVVFDNGRKRAEREFAAADVEVAAVTLSEDTNARVYDALSLYLKAEEGRARAQLAEAAITDMTRFEWVLNERVKGGVSNMSDLNVVRHKLAEMRSLRDAARESTAQALAELNAMSVEPLDGLSGLDRVDLAAAEPLAVLRAEAEKTRAVAEAKMARAGQLPGVSANATVGGGDPRASLNTSGRVGFGTAASLRAVEAQVEGAERKVVQARETATRSLRGQEQQLKGLERQAAEAEGLSRAAKTNLDLFQAQFEGGQRQVMEVVGVYETFAAQQQEQARLAYDAARLRLRMARDLGLLANGSEV